MYLNFLGEGPVVLIGQREFTEGRKKVWEPIEINLVLGQSVCFYLNEELQFNDLCE